MLSRIARSGRYALHSQGGETSENATPANRHPALKRHSAASEVLYDLRCKKTRPILLPLWQTLPVVPLVGRTATVVGRFSSTTGLID